MSPTLKKTEKEDNKPFELIFDENKEMSPILKKTEKEDNKPFELIFDENKEMSPTLKKTEKEDNKPFELIFDENKEMSPTLKKTEKEDNKPFELILNETFPIRKNNILVSPTSAQSSTLSDKYTDWREKEIQSYITDKTIGNSTKNSDLQNKKIDEYKKKPLQRKKRRRSPPQKCWLLDWCEKSGFCKRHGK